MSQSLPFEVTGLDHVAIEVKDLDASARWYVNHLGFKHYKVNEWGEYPRFLIAGTTGLALFPDAGTGHSHQGTMVVNHIAFRVSMDHLKAARTHLEEHGLKVAFQDHHYFHSIYFSDPDGHKLELTAAVPGTDFYSLTPQPL